MVEAIPDMPPGTLGFRTSGEITAEDYREIISPALKPKLKAGESLRVLVVLGEGLKERPMAAWEAAKTDLSLGVEHRELWERTAVVTDIGWIKRGMSLFGGFAPGELKTFSEDQLEKARAWTAG